MIRSPLKARSLPQMATKVTPDVVAEPDWSDEDVAESAKKAIGAAARVHDRHDVEAVYAVDQITIDYGCRASVDSYDESGIPMLLNVYVRPLPSFDPAELRLRLDRKRTAALWIAQPNRVLCVYRVEEVG